MTTTPPGVWACADAAVVEGTVQYDNEAKEKTQQDDLGAEWHDLQASTEALREQMEVLRVKKVQEAFRDIREELFRQRDAPSP